MHGAIGAAADLFLDDILVYPVLGALVLIARVFSHGVEGFLEKSLSPAYHLSNCYNENLSSQFNVAASYLDLAMLGRSPLMMSHGTRILSRRGS